MNRGEKFSITVSRIFLLLLILYSIKLLLLYFKVILLLLNGISH